MLEINKTHIGDTVETMKLIDDRSIQLILTSPPYRAGMRKDRNKYPDAKDVVKDNESEEEYVDTMIKVFKQYERILKDDGTIAFNLSYNTFGPSLPYKVISEIFNKTGLTISDTAYWKKSSCVPVNGHSTALTRIVEPVYIFVKKEFLNKTKSNKLVRSVSNTGQKFYIPYYNYIETKNNDGKVEGHDATYSVDFACYFIDLYSEVGDLVLDNFMGTGTTGVACKELRRNYIGIDLIDKYVEYSENRIKNYVPENDLYVTLKDEDSIESVPIYHKNLPKVGEDFIINNRLKKIVSVKKINGSFVIELVKNIITQDVIEKNAEYYAYYHKWLYSRKISDDEKEYLSDDLSNFLRYVKNCKKHKTIWENIKSMG